MQTPQSVESLIQHHCYIATIDLKDVYPYVKTDNADDKTWFPKLRCVYGHYFNRQHDWQMRRQRILVFLNHFSPEVSRHI